MNLVVDNQVVRTATGNDSPLLSDASWDVSALVGKKAHLEVVDSTTSPERGYILVDDILFLAKASAPELPDFNRQLGTVNQSFQALVQKEIQALAEQYKVVGATVAVVVDMSLQATVAVGKRKFGSPEPLLVTDPMHVGSNTKGMTALLFGRLVEKGKLRFDETVREAFPYLVSPDFVSLPLIELLYQRSGITDATAAQIFDAKYLPSDPANRYHGPAKLYSEERQVYVHDCLVGRVGYPPRSKMEYCNANFIVAGAAEELASGGKPWEELIQLEVFTPLHMKAAGFSAMGTGKNVETPWQHVSKNGIWEPIYHDNPGYFGPAGTVHCSALDLANYATARVFGAYEKGSYLSAQTWQILQTPPDGSGYACGIAVGGPDANGIRNMSHGGSNNMSCSDWWVRHHGRIIVVSMINCQSPEANKAILEGIVKLTEEHFGIAN